MKRLLLTLLPAVLIAGQARYARLGEFEGKVEVQMRAGEAWMAAERNLPLVEGAWLRTGAGSRLEIELDEGSAWRLGPDTQVEISDYTRLSTGQRFTILSLDHGVAYFTGEPGARDTLTLAVPGAQITLSRGARVRLEADARGEPDGGDRGLGAAVLPGGGNGYSRGPDGARGAGEFGALRAGPRGDGDGIGSLERGAR